MGSEQSEPVARGRWWCCGGAAWLNYIVRQPHRRTHPRPLPCREGRRGETYPGPSLKGGEGTTGEVTHPRSASLSRPSLKGKGGSLPATVAHVPLPCREGMSVRLLLAFDRAALN